MSCEYIHLTTAWCTGHPREPRAAAGTPPPASAPKPADGVPKGHVADGPVEQLAVYVAASSAPEHRRRVRAAMRLIESWGPTRLTHDWLTVIEQAGVGNGELTDDQRIDAAAVDLDAVQAADIVWLLADETPSEGAATELGAALAWGKAIVVSGQREHVRRNVFTSLARAVLVFEGGGSDVAAFRAIVGRAREVTS